MEVGAEFKRKVLVLLDDLQQAVVGDTGQGVLDGLQLAVHSAQAHRLPTISHLNEHIVVVEVLLEGVLGHRALHRRPVSRPGAPRLEVGQLLVRNTDR